jgi:hypothetical protein
MKKQIVSAIVLAGMIASSSAFASRARNMVLGQGGAEFVSGANFGSFYYEDAYNFFYNAAYVNDYKNWVIVEKGTSSDAMFGVVTSMMNFNLGVFANRTGGLGNTANFEDPIEIILGGDAGVKWGLGAQFQQAGSGSDKSRELNLRAGFSFSGLDPFIGYRVIGKDEAGATETKYKGYNAGLRYHFGEWTPYAAYVNNEVETPTAATSSESKTWLVGIGRETKLAEGARLVYAAYYANTKTDVGPASTKANTLPLNVGVEADALSWLTLRAGVAYVIAGNAGRTTTGRLGGTFHVSKVDLDYAFGNDTGTTTAGTTGTISSTPDSPNVGFDSGTFHRVALRYSW